MAACSRGRQRCLRLAPAAAAWRALGAAATDLLSQLSRNQPPWQPFAAAGLWSAPAVAALCGFIALGDTRLRRAVSDLTLDKLILTEAARGNF
jgi:hypothetical protein